jgi:hypothetical protein
MSQIKRKFNNASYTLSLFRQDMLLLFANAKLYNLPGSWAHDSAATMEEEFNEQYDRELAQLSGGTPAQAHSALAKVEDESPGASGSSTPMFKHGAPPIPPRIKINMGASKRSKEVLPSDESASEDDDDDDDYK